MLLSSLVLLEAKASSEVENIVTTTDRLFQFADHHEEKADSATKEALRDVTLDTPKNQGTGATDRARH